MASYLSGFEHLEIQLQEIKKATKNFHESKVIGVGGFGKVYKGELSYPDGKRMVAFKRLDRKHGQGDPEFFKEIRMLSCYKHKNLISLLGFCKKGDEMILIYEYASQGSLDRILHDANLKWTQRLKICLDAAEGLGFLHDPKGSQQRVLHCDIKSANILLDESLNAKVADFGLSKISPANQQYTLLVTSPVGTHGYCDPLYMNDYQLTKESDVYSFGVVLFEVLCGRVCYENSNGKLKIFVHFWKKCYEEKKLDEIIFPDLKQQMDPSSAKTFVDIAYQCLQETRKKRPIMSVVVKNLKDALEFQEGYDLKLHEVEQMRKAAEQEKVRKAAEHNAEQMRKDAEQERMRQAAELEQMCKAAEQEYKEILKSADPPLRFLEFPVNGGKTLLSINDKGEVFCERICIEACLDQFQYGDHLKYPFGFENSRFSGGCCYYKHKRELKLRVGANFLYPQMTYSVNLVFRNHRESVSLCKTLHYSLDGETRCCMVYDTYEREDGWFVVPFYQFTSDQKTADFEIDFKVFPNGCKLHVAGFEFQTLEEKVELHDQRLKEYQDIVKAASQSLFYKSSEELKELLAIGFHINNHKTWFSLNENGEHREMLSIADCLISPQDYLFGCTDHYSRFPRFLETNKKGFKVHIRTQFLTPSIRYTVNLVFDKRGYSWKQKYVGLKYKLEGETETSIVHFANKTKDNRSFIAELYQFTSNGRTFDLDIVFEDHIDDLQVQGILFQPLEKVEHEQLLEHEELQWKLKENLFTNLLKCFGIYNDQEGYAVDNNGKKSSMFSARGVVINCWSFQSSFESRFGEVAVITGYSIDLRMHIRCDVLSPETTYATYLIYKLPQDQFKFDGLVKRTNYGEGSLDYSYFYLVTSPPETPTIGQKLDQNTHNPKNRDKVYAVSRQRKDSWMEVKVWQFQTPPSSTETVYMSVTLESPRPSYTNFEGLSIESVEHRPIVRNSV